MNGWMDGSVGVMWVGGLCRGEIFAGFKGGGWMFLL